MFLISDKECFKSVSESNKPGMKIITSLVEKEIAENQDTTMETEYIENFDVSNAKQMESKLYIINKSQIFEEFKEYITLFGTQPNVRCKEGKVVYICFKNDDNERVVVACDTNYGKCADKVGYENLQQECLRNGIKYTNQGVGTIVNQMLDKFNGVVKRRHLTKDEKNIIHEKSNRLCACCQIKCKKYQYDHIIPLSGGGTDEIDNFQILCPDCHLKKTTEEQQDGTYKMESKIYSSFNNIVIKKIIDTPHFKTHQFVERIKEEIGDVPCHKIDGKRFRKNILYYSNYEFPVYSVMDVAKSFSGKIQCGYYYVSTEHLFPLRGSGWYCQGLVEYCLKHNIITLDNIWYEFLPSNRLPANYFRERIDFILKSFENPQLQKLLINALIGCWGIQKKHSTYSKFSLKEDEASQWFVDNDNVFMCSYPLGEHTLYEAIYQNEIAVDDNAYPLYSMVLQKEALELHTLERIVIKNKGIPLDRNTDAIRFQRNEPIDISNYFWDEEKTQPKYQNEYALPLKHESKPHSMRYNYLQQTEEFDLHWNLSIDNSNIEDIINKKEGMLINGRAGTGKTYLVNQLINTLKQKELKYACLAPTNKSARLIEGMTLDKLNFKSISNNNKLVQWALSIQYLIVDEISMVKEKFYRLLTNIKKINPKIIFFVCGDFGQLEPVNDTWKGDYKNSPVLFNLCQNNKLVLTKCKRSDEYLFNLCKNVDDVKVQEFPLKVETNLNLAYYHSTRKQINNDCMERNLKLQADTPIYIPEDEDNPKTQNLKLVKGMPIICHRTEKKLEILNSDRFIITYIDDQRIEFTNELLKETEHAPINMETKDFHKYFYLAYCITIHASQGETFKAPYTIYDWGSIGRKAKYVALSRGTDRNNIQIHMEQIEKTYFNFKKYLSEREIPEDHTIKMVEVFKKLISK